MGIVLDKLKLLRLGQQKKIWAITQPFFVLEQNWKKYPSKNWEKVDELWPIFFLQRRSRFDLSKFIPIINLWTSTSSKMQISQFLILCSTQETGAQFWLIWRDCVSEIQKGYSLSEKLGLSASIITLSGKLKK